TTDVTAPPATLHKALKAAVEPSFNAITIDSEMSTSDIVALLASGAAANKPVKPGSAAYKKFAAAVAEVCGELARAIVADGEGATKIIEITVRGARSAAEAEIAAKSVANSPLLKCAVHGGDPNWGRVVVALGKSAATVDAEKLSVRIGDAVVFARGTPRKLSAAKTAKLEKHLAGETVEILCDLGLGRGRYTALTCDLSREYIKINADYHT
ncbi:MAG: bifunctional ornithine acetyltransferase/N-acetylglutamate synthase, partial [Phycisphaerae bacterium]|nr:bifunctional ornithine acetyltransferase/N-acetylglutamate synthase [Phycisphaerae bacterium]